MSREPLPLDPCSCETPEAPEQQSFEPTSTSGVWLSYRCPVCGLACAAHPSDRRARERWNETVKADTTHFAFFRLTVGVSISDRGTIYRTTRPITTEYMARSAEDAYRSIRRLAARIVRQEVYFDDDGEERNDPALESVKLEVKVVGRVLHDGSVGSHGGPVVFEWKRADAQRTLDDAIERAIDKGGEVNA